MLGWVGNVFIFEINIFILNVVQYYVSVEYSIFIRLLTKPNHCYDQLKLISCFNHFITTILNNILS